VIHASGGVVVRDGRVMVVHRPRYDDWSLPKGKRDPGETDEQCAVREVAEETGLWCRLDREVLPVRYVDQKRRPKIVRYWTMSVFDERPFTANDEIDEIRWLEFDDAMERLSYAHDVDVLLSARS
jgi:8-oxo-dGTP diphosphatase